MMQARSRDRARKPRNTGSGSENLAQDVANLSAAEAAALREVESVVRR
jgi:hypothetical protein